MDKPQGMKFSNKLDHADPKLEHVNLPKIFVVIVENLVKICSKLFHHNELFPIFEGSLRVRRVRFPVVN